MNDAQKKYGFIGASVGVIAMVLTLKTETGEKKTNPFLALSIGAIVGFIVIPPIYSYLLDKKTDK